MRGMKDLWELYWTYLKIGCVNFGGGYAMLPLLERELVSKKGWTTMEELRDYFAIGQCTPGVIALNVSTFIGTKKKGTAGAIGINMSTYAGFKTAGIPGGILATFGLALPSIIIILIIARFLAKFRKNRLVEGAFYGLRPASIAMITVAGLNVAKVSLLNLEAFGATGAVGDLFAWKAILLGVALFIAQKKLKWHPVVFIAISAVVGIVLQF